MPFNIEEFKAALNNANGLVNQSHFMAMITSPPSLQGEESNFVRDIPFFCETTSLPGLAFEAQPVKHHGYGLFERRPYNAAFAPLPMIFLCDSTGNMLKFFHKWMQSITNWNMDTGSNREANGLGKYEFQYPDRYETTIEVYAYDTAGNEVVKYTLEKAFPLEVVDIPVSWNASDSIVRVPVTFFYKSWKSEALSRGEETNVESLSYSLTRLDSGVASAVAGALLYPSQIASAINTVINQSFYVQ